MKKYLPGSWATAFLLAMIVWLCGKIDLMPWWGFIIPVAGLGVVAGWKKWKIAGFSAGFLAGFIVWAGGNFVYDRMYGGGLVQRFGPVVTLVALIISGVIGGLLTGLAFCTGRTLADRKEDKFHL